MGWWTATVVPRIVDRALRGNEVELLRERSCAGLNGSVLEIGFGSGRNLPHYPSSVHRVQAVEPSDVAWAMAQPRIETAQVAVTRVGLDGARIDLPDRSVDHVLSTFTLCTIPDVAGALREVARVLTPGGSFRFVEHGRSPDPSVSRWQERLDGFHRAFCGGCHLTRSVALLMDASDLTVTRIEHSYASGPRPLGYISVGVAMTTSAAA